MANPPIFQPGFNYSNWQATNPVKPLPAQQVDNDFANVGRSVNQAISAIGDVRRSDGKLKNGIVGPDALAPQFSLGFSFEGNWASGIEYQAGDGVVFSQVFYAARVSHTSSVANQPGDEDTWTLLFSLADIVVSGALSMPTASFLSDGVTDEFDLDFFPISNRNLFVTIGGQIQEPTEYTIAGSKLRFVNGAPPTGPLGEAYTITARGFATTGTVVVPDALYMTAKNFTGPGTTYTLDVAPGSATNVIVSVGGAPQKPLVDFNVSGVTLTLTEDPGAVSVQTLIIATTANMNTLGGQGADYFRDRTNHTGTQLPDTVYGAVWTSGTLRTMRDRARDVYSILDAPGGADPTGTNDSTTALQAMMTQNAAKYELTAGTFTSSQRLYVPAGSTIEGQGGGSRFGMRTSLIFFGTGTKDIALTNFVQTVIANPGAGEAYLADSGTRGDNYTTLDLTGSNSAAVRLRPGSGLKNLGIYPFLAGGLGEYLNGSSYAMSDDWGTGVWADNADYWRMENCDVAGHWRNAALLVSANGAGPAGSCEKGQALHCRFQGFRGVAIRSAFPADNNYGFAGTAFVDCDIRPLNHQSAHLATSSMLATPFSSPSACLEISGGTMRGVKFINSTFIGRDDINMIFSRSSEMQFEACYSEGQNVRVSGTFMTNGQGSRMVANSFATSIYMNGNKKYAVDYTPYQFKDAGLTPGRYTAAGVFNPAFCYDEEARRPRSTTSDDVRLLSGQSFRVLDTTGAEVAKIGSDFSVDTLTTAGAYKVNGTKVAGTRKTGWAADASTAKRTANASYSATTASASYTQAEISALMTQMTALSGTIRALKDDLISHGLIGA